SDTASANYPAFTGSDPSAVSSPFYPEQAGDAHTGWSMWTGFGRVDAYAAAAYARAGLVPPEAQMYGDTPPPTNAFKGLAGPQNFALIDPRRRHTVPIVGHVAAPHAPGGQRVDWRVQVAPCLEPQEADFADVGSGSGRKDGLLATWNLPQSPGQCAGAGGTHPFSPPGTYTIRVLARLDGAGGSPVAVTNPVAGSDPNGGGPPAPLVGEDRRVVYLRSSPADHAKSPYALGASGEASPTLYDLEGRGQLDIVEPTSDGTIVALRPDGKRVHGWPVRMAPLAGGHPQRVGGQRSTGQIVGSVAVGDIDGDGAPEVIAQSFNGGLYAWHRNGRRVKGFPVAIPPRPTFVAPHGGTAPGTSADWCRRSHPAVYGQRYSDYGAISAPVLADLNGDRRLDIVSAQSNQCVYAVSGRGKVQWAASPNDTHADTSKIADTPAVGDLDGDGRPEVVLGTGEVAGSIPQTTGRLYALDGRTGKLKPGWPVTLHSLAGNGVPTVAAGVVSSPVLFPATGGKGLEVGGGMFLQGDNANPVHTYRADGSPVATLDMTSSGSGSNTTDTPSHWAIGQAAVGAIGGSQHAIVTGTLGNSVATDTALDPSKKPQFQHAVGAWDTASGQPIGTFPRQIEDWQFLSGPVIADVKGDGSEQVIAGSGGGYVHAFDPAAGGSHPNFSTSLSPYSDRDEPAGFPVQTGGYITSTPAVGQLSRRGKVAVVTATRDGYLFVTDTAGRANANNQWWHFHHDERNTGAYGVDTRPPATVTDLRVRAGKRAHTKVVSWTEVGDDWWSGQVAAVDLRWSVRPITQKNFRRAHRVRVKAPAASGKRERVKVSGLPANGRIYFGERGVDRAGNVGLLRFAR
ncbi:MAG: cell wall-associated protease, partial [Thermoleophilaceae bacterium]|nr:cell wall-associated protease [Thermoleophilaceae bacterium]